MSFRLPLISSFSFPFLYLLILSFFTFFPSFFSPLSLLRLLVLNSHQPLLLSVLALLQLGKWLVHFCDEIIITDLDKYGEGEGERHEGREEGERER